MLKYQELSLEMIRPDLNLSYSSRYCYCQDQLLVVTNLFTTDVTVNTLFMQINRETPVVNLVKPHQETFLLGSKHGLILNLLVDALDCTVDFTSLMLLKRYLLINIRIFFIRIPLIFQTLVMHY